MDRQEMLKRENDLGPTKKPRREKSSNYIKGDQPTTMASVFTDNVECPLCGANTAHTDLEIHTNEREWDCVRCGFHSHTRIVVRAGKQFWEHTMELPMSKDGKVAWPEMQAVRSFPHMSHEK